MVANELVKDSSYKVFFISLFEEQPQPFFPIDEAINGTLCIRQSHTVFSITLIR